MGSKGKFDDGKVNESVLCKGKCSDWEVRGSVVIGKLRKV